MTIDQTFNLSLQHHQAGRLAEAEKLYRQILAEKPNHAESLHYLGIVASQMGRKEIAVELIRQAIVLKPGYHEAHNNLGIVLAEMGRSNEAAAAYQRAVALKPEFPEAFNNLGNALRGSGQLDQAVAAFRRAIVLRPNYAHAYSNLGNALRDIGQPDEAIGAFRQAIAIEPGYADAYSNLGNSLHDKGMFEEAIAAYRQAIALKPEYSEAHYNLALMLLMRGDLRQGWAEHEWRWRVKNFPVTPLNCTQPQWDGADLADRTILLHGEQGVGDALQFIRYLPLVAERCGKVIVSCAPKLRRLLQTMPGAAKWLDQGGPLPAFDVHCPLLTLPLALGTTLETIPHSVPYLHTDPANVERWRKRLGEYANTAVEKGVGVPENRSVGAGAPGGAHTDTPTTSYPDTRRSTASSAGAQVPFNVGITWAGSQKHKNDRNRSVPVALLAPLAEVPGVRFYSLQKSDLAGKTQKAPPGMKCIDWTSDLADFADTAALIANLDLVISVDTAVAHLAGALGKPVWILLPSISDWRWLRDRDDSPWYPTMRLFRQPVAGDWQSVVRNVSKALCGHLPTTENPTPNTSPE